MRVFCRLFCALAAIFTILYVVQLLLDPSGRGPERVIIPVVALSIYVVLYGLYQFIRRLRINPALWRIIY